MLTERQQSILDYILDFRRRQGCSPSIPELQKAFGIRSPNGVAGHLDALEAKGYIRRAKRGSRQIDVTGPLAVLRSPSYDLPLFRRLPGGKPVGCVTVDETTLGFRPKDGCFAIKVRGDSVRSAGILDGDLVVVEPTAAPRAGRIVVAIVGGETVLRRLASTPSRLAIQGIVRAVIRRLS